MERKVDNLRHVHMKSTAFLAWIRQHSKPLGGKHSLTNVFIGKESREPETKHGRH